MGLLVMGIIGGLAWTGHAQQGGREGTDFECGFVATEIRERDVTAIYVFQKEFCIYGMVGV